MGKTCLQDSASQFFHIMTQTENDKICREYWGKRPELFQWKSPALRLRSPSLHANSASPAIHRTEGKQQFVTPVMHLS